MKYAWAGLLTLLAVAAFPARATVIEDFDDGVVELLSFPGEDAHPDSWVLDSVRTQSGSPWALKLFGNTWKLESIAPVELDTGDVWQVSAFVGSLGEIQGFGLTSSCDTMFYSFAGTQQLNNPEWVTVYQGAFPLDTWNTYQLPVADDWLARFGYLPTITGIVFLNDRDTDPHAVVWFDDVLDITDVLPMKPQVRIWYTVGDIFKGRGGAWEVGVQFHSRVIDPDSEHHEYSWFFGDDSTSGDSNPYHTYVIEDDHQYTVLLEVTDSTGQRGRATCRVTVDPGPTTFPVLMNFTGDIMLARRYELPGGIIDTLGPEGIFEPTLPYLGDAADITVVNLECPLTTRGTRHPTKSIVFRGRPTNVAGLAYAGIDIVSLANNHVIDYGLEGMRETQEVLGAHDILYSGAGANSYEAYQPVFYQKSGVNIAFLASCNRTGQYDNYQPYLDAGFNKPGFANLDSFHLSGQIRGVRADADVVVVEMHAGKEYEQAPGDGGEEPEDEFYSPFALIPDFPDVQLRHQAVDEGADLVVCHHPHVLQGFEVYNGKLIAHSMGNFAFDQTYTETFASVILQGSIDATGFYHYSLTPVFVDDYIPRPAQGELGLHILDYLARRSIGLGTYVIVDRDSVVAEVVLDTLALSPWNRTYVDDLQCREAAGWWVSDPLCLPRNGTLSAVLSAVPQRNWQFRTGRDAVWFGNCEDEGSTMWLFDQADEFYDTVPYQGARSLCQVRPEGSGLRITNLENRMVCYSDSTAYTLYCHIKCDNGDSVTAAIRYYSTRTGYTPRGTIGLGTEVNGTTDWAFYHNGFTPPDGSRYYDVRLLSRGPGSGGPGRAWFDDIGVIEWGEWQTLDSPTPVLAPNDFYWVQIRADTETPAAELSYQEVIYEPGVAVRDRSALQPVIRAFRVHPNPARALPAIRYDLTRTARVVLRIYNALGQEVRTLVDGTQACGPKTITWDGHDNRGRVLGSGTYFCRLQVGRHGQSRKIVLHR